MKSTRFFLPTLLLSQLLYPQTLPSSAGIAGIALAGDTIVVGTFDAGVIRSTDAGISWTAASSGLPTNEIWSIAFDGLTALAGTEQGIFRSTNAGESWTSANSGLTDLNIYTLFIRDSIALATTYVGLFRSTDGGSTWSSVVGPNGNDFASSGDTIYTTLGGRVFRSTSAGSTWNELTDGTSPGWAQGIAVQGINIYAGKSAGGVLFSPDHGSSWEERGLDSAMVTYATYCLFASSTHVFAGTLGDGVFVSADSGLTWTQSDSGLTDPFMTCIEGDDSVVFAGTNTGLFRSADMGISWQIVRFGTGLGKVEAFLEHGGSIFAATEAGIYRLEGDSAWVPKDSGLTVVSTSSLASLGPTLFAGTRGGGVFRSTDLGEHWQPSNAGITDTLIESMAVRDSVMFAGGHFAGVFRSLDSGVTWTPTTSIGVPQQSILSQMVWNEQLFAGHEGGVVLSTDDGESWSNRSTGISFGYIKAIARMGDTLFACSGSGGGVYRSTDTAQTWHEVNTGLVNWFVMALAVNGQTLYAGSQEGLYESTDRGESWALFDSSLNGTFVQSVYPREDEILVGTASGVRRLAYAQTPTSARTRSSTVPMSLRLFPNYPNPFNPSTTIRFHLSERSWVTVEVIDLLGRRVAMLVNEDLESGVHSTEWIAGQQPSGMYFCRIKTSATSAMQRMVLVR